jgi:hypothetical protein
MSTLLLSDIVQVNVLINQGISVRSGFNEGLIVGKSTIISAVTRVVEYASLAAMIAGGWAGSEPEYLAAQKYFAQIPAPQKVAIGRWDGTGAETSAQAITACRAANSTWYACLVCGAAKADIVGVAGIIETAVPSSVQFYTTSDNDAKAGTEGNVFDALADLSYRRSIGQWSTTADAAAAIMGYAMGANTGLANSAYTLAYKSEVGVTADTLTSAEVAFIKGDNGNCYINRGNQYNLFEQGMMADGSYFDEVINLDILVNSIQLNVMDLLTGVPKVPQTEGGVALLVDAISQPCKTAKETGFIAPGIWTAAPVLTLNTNDMLSDGFLVLADTISNQSSNDRAARKAPPIYVPIKLAGAIEHVVISITVNR